MKPEYEHIVSDVLEAIAAAKRGEAHHRLNQMMVRTEKERNRQAAFYASFYPKQPHISQAIESPYYHFTKDYYGLGGDVKSD